MMADVIKLLMTMRGTLPAGLNGFSCFNFMISLGHFHFWNICGTKWFHIFCKCWFAMLLLSVFLNKC